MSSISRNPYSSQRRELMEQHARSGFDFMKQYMEKSGPVPTTPKASYSFPQPYASTQRVNTQYSHSVIRTLEKSKLDIERMRNPVQPTAKTTCECPGIPACQETKLIGFYNIYKALLATCEELKQECKVIAHKLDMLNSRLVDVEYNQRRIIKHLKRQERL